MHKEERAQGQGRGGKVARAGGTRVGWSMGRMERGCKGERAQEQGVQGQEGTRAG